VTDERALRAAGDAIRALAGKWDTMAGDMKKVSGTIDQLWLTPLAFAVADQWAGPPVSIDQFSIYNDVHKMLCSLLSGAAVEFGQIGNALRILATEYERADEGAYINLNKIYSAQ
jgi:hypothetical protein